MPARDWLTRNKSINSTKSGKISLEFTILLLRMIHQSGRVGSGIIPAKCVFKINEDRRVRPQDGRPEQNTCLCKWCMMCLCICLFFISKELKGFTCKLWNINHFIAYGNISLNNSLSFHVWKFLQRNPLSSLKKILIFWWYGFRWMHECMNATITLKDQAKHTRQRSWDSSYYP